MDKRLKYSVGWRDMNSRGAKRSIRKRVGVRLIILSLALCLVAAFGILFYPLEAFKGVEGPSGDDFSAGNYSENPSERTCQPLSITGPEELKLELCQIEKRFTLEKEGVPLTVESSLDPKLQRFVEDLLEKSQTYKAAAVVLNPANGRILAMASYDSESKGEELCLKAGFPAASLFKIVSAAAAVEKAGFSPEKKVSFVGRKHTLYKNQLKNKKSRYSATVSFKRAFASSINPVFGKLGIYDLGPEVLTESAENFFFNRSIPFDLQVETSEAMVPETDFSVAEMASGFNKKTTISPLHAALLSSAVVNDGVIMKPWLVKRVVDEKGRVLYENSASPLGKIMKPETAKALRILMKDTILHGTCRKAFWRERRRKVYKGVELGAKTGTINDPTDRFKYDWLTAYVVPPGKSDEICIAVLGIHGKMLGLRANRLGRSIIRYYLSS